MDDEKDEAIEALRNLHDAADGHSRQEAIDALTAVRDEAQELIDALSDF